MNITQSTQNSKNAQYQHNKIVFHNTFDSSCHCSHEFHVIHCNFDFSCHVRLPHSHLFRSYKCKIKKTMSHSNTVVPCL